MILMDTLTAELQQALQVSWEHSLGRENVEKGGVELSKFVTTTVIIVLLKLKVNPAGSPLSIVTACVMPSCVKVKVPD